MCPSFQLLRRAVAFGPFALQFLSKPNIKDLIFLYLRRAQKAQLGKVWFFFCQQLLLAIFLDDPFFIAYFLLAKKNVMIKYFLGEIAFVYKFKFVQYFVKVHLILAYCFWASGKRPSKEIACDGTTYNIHHTVSILYYGHRKL